MVRRLSSYGPMIGLVVGAFQEGSKDLYTLLGTLADSQLRVKGLAWGREGTDQVLGEVVVEVFTVCILDLQAPKMSFLLNF